MIKKKQSSGKMKIDLTGPQGNAFFLLGTGRKLAQQLNLDWGEINNEMTSSDYENLIQVFDKYFGDYVILYK